MIAWLNKLIRALYCVLTARPAPTRVGPLDTGELVQVDGPGYAQVLGAQTTDVIRDVLAAGESQTVHLTATDPVHRVLAVARQ